MTTPDEMQIRFTAVAEARPGERWQQLFRDLWPKYREWFLRDGEGRRPGYVRCRAMLRRHLPELVPLWERLVDLAGGGDQQARMLSLYCPTSYMSGCSQVVSDGPDGPLLVRNYDYHPRLCEGVVLRSKWHDTDVIASCDCMWGVLDGVNEHGLAVSLSFGGSRRVGEGFGIPLILRYVLEFCRDVASGVAVLERVPSNMAYNVSLADAAGERATLHVGPGRPALAVPEPYATNHQAEVEWHEHATATRTREREARIVELLGAGDPERLEAAFLEPPLYQTEYSRAFGTLYTAVYAPREGIVRMRWPGRSWRFGFDAFPEGELLVRYADGE